MEVNFQASLEDLRQEILDSKEYVKKLEDLLDQPEQEQPLPGAGVRVCANDLRYLAEYAREMARIVEKQPEFLDEYNEKARLVVECSILLQKKRIDSMEKDLAESLKA